ncbi:MAG: hypothetical protein Kow0013_23820 [Pararhodobacter sp.]
MPKTLKALAECKDRGLGDLLDGIVLHAGGGKDPVSPETRAAREQLRAVHGCTWAAMPLFAPPETSRRVPGCAPRFTNRPTARPGWG